MLQILEEWKDIEGYEDMYQVSNFGRVKSLSRLLNNKDGFFYSKEKILKPRKNSRGYVCVVLNKKDGGKDKTIHRLVAEAFIPNPDNKETINHKDANQTNNHVDNLEWNTQKENVHHAMENGLFRKTDKRLCLVF